MNSLRLFAAVIAALALAACSDSTDPGDPEPEVAEMVVTIDGTAYTAGASGFGAQIASVGGDAVAVSAAFLNDEGDPDPAVTGADFQLSVAGNADGGPLPAGVTFTRTGAFTGTLTVPEGETATIFLGLFHVEEEHDDFGPFPLSVERP